MTESNDLAAIVEPLPERMSRRDRLSRAMGGEAWTIGLVVVFVALFAATLLLRPNYGLEALAIASLPVAFAAAGQAIVVISGGIDLSIGSVIALINVISAVLFLNAPELSVPVVAARPAHRHRDRSHKRLPRSHQPRPRHRRHALDAVRLGRRRIARPADARRRFSRLAR